MARNLFVLALALAPLTLSAAPALACGGYGPTVREETPAARAVRLALEERVGRWRRGAPVSVNGIRIEGDEAVAVVFVLDSRDRLSAHDARLRLRDGEWRVLSIS